MTRFFKFLIRISSFLNKELIEIFRQPRLIITLIMGPFLIMFLFGLGYPNQSRVLKTVFVVSDPKVFKQEMDTFNNSFGVAIFDYVIAADNELALKELALNQVDLVIVVPDAPFKTVQGNQQAQFLVYHNEVDPIQIGYIQSVANLYVDEVNRQILQSTAEQAQKDSGPLQANVDTAIVKIQALRQAIPASDTKSTTQAAELEKDLSDLRDKLGLFRSMAAGILVNPFVVKVSGLFNIKLSITGFFAPAVIVLLLQHVSITFASLSIVRETRSGIMELFRVSPITAFETMLGKYISYMFFESILAAVLTSMVVRLMGIPILGSLRDYALAVAVLLFTSLGVGFFISLISQTDTQAVQYSMLLMLASIFFSGFFLDLRLMQAPITYLAWSLPATYGIRMLQDVMLRGTAVPTLVIGGLAAIGVVLFVVDWRLLRRRMES
jgi:ABC-2 type transport system permease protein